MPLLTCSFLFLSCSSLSFQSCHSSIAPLHCDGVSVSGLKAMKMGNAGITDTSGIFSAPSAFDDRKWFRLLRILYTRMDAFKVRKSGVCDTDSSIEPREQRWQTMEIFRADGEPPSLSGSFHEIPVCEYLVVKGYFTTEEVAVPPVISYNPCLGTSSSIRPETPHILHP